MNRNLRRRIAQVVYKTQNGHIPSAFSIVDILDILYQSYLKYNPQDPYWKERDYFILSKGHGCVALYAVLEKYGFLTQEYLETFCTKEGILGEHPDCTKIPGVEASTGSLGHGFSYAIGIALGLRIQGRCANKVYILVGDGECHEGTVWEAAHVAYNLQLGNICVIVDWNGSAAQLMPRDDLPAKWQAFGWNTMIIDGHSEESICSAFNRISFQPTGTPSVIIAKTIKGKGVPMLEGHGVWHHRIPTESEYQIIQKALS